jgi:hypothetical protein
MSPLCSGIDFIDKSVRFIMLITSTFPVVLWPFPVQ